MGSPYGGELVDTPLTRKASKEYDWSPSRKEKRVGMLGIFERAIAA